MGIIDISDRFKKPDSDDDRSTVVLDNDGFTFFDFDGSKRRWLWCDTEYICVGHLIDDYLSYFFCKNVDEEENRRFIEAPENTIDFEKLSKAMRELPNWDENRFEEEMRLYKEGKIDEAFIWEREGDSRSNEPAKLKVTKKQIKLTDYMGVTHKIQWKDIEKVTRTETDDDYLWNFYDKSGSVVSVGCNVDDDNEHDQITELAPELLEGWDEQTDEFYDKFWDVDKIPNGDYLMWTRKNT